MIVQGWHQSTSLPDEPCVTLPCGILKIKWVDSQPLCELVSFPTSLALYAYVQFLKKKIKKMRFAFELFYVDFRLFWQCNAKTRKERSLISVCRGALKWCQVTDCCCGHMTKRNGPFPDPPAPAVALFWIYDHSNDA